MNYKSSAIVIISIHILIVALACFSSDTEEKQNDPIILRSVKLEKEMPVQIKKNASAPPTKPLSTPKKLPQPKKATAPKSTSVAQPKKDLGIDNLTVPTLDNKVKKVDKIEVKISFQEALEELEKLIELPKKGLAKISLSISLDGEILDIDFIDCSEDENRHYLIETLRGYKLPLTERLSQEKQIILNLRGI